MNGTTAALTAADGIPRDLIDRFAAAVGRLLPEGGRIGLAVSGGPDSTAMLLLAHAAMPDRVEVATVDHGLRPAAKDECALVQRQCAALGIACAILPVIVEGNNLQSAARRARYSGLSAWAEDRGLAAIATAHHADDQAETLLMRLNRGSGVHGLAGVREIGWTDGFGGSVIRPLLTFRRAELMRVVETSTVKSVHDPSNDDDRFDRVRIRKAIADADWLDPLAMASSASHLGDAVEALDEYFRRVWREQVKRAGDTYRYRPPASKLIEMRIVEKIISELGRAELGKPPRGQDIARLIGRLYQIKGGNLGGVLVTVEDAEWVFRPEPPRRTG